MLLNATRIVVPEALREELLVQAHVGYQGVNKMYIASKYFWPMYKTRIAEVRASCRSCQRPSGWPWSHVPFVLCYSTFTFTFP